MKNISIWQSDKFKRYNNKMPRNLTTDILIIGGGITGISSAYFLDDCNRKITLIDRDGIGSGVTGKTTAKISYLQGIIYQTLISNFSKKVAKKYLNSQLEAISLILKIIDKYNISCDLKKVDSIIFTLEDKNVSKIELEQKILSCFDIDVTMVNSNLIKSGIKVSGTYSFNPLKYLHGIAENLKNTTIYENVLAESLSYNDNKYYIKTNKGMIVANTVIMAIHYPFFILPTFIPFKTYIKREYVTAAKVNLDNISNYMAINIDKKLHSIRFYNDYLIYNSNSHRLTNNIDYGKNYDNSISEFKRHFNRKPMYFWMNQDVMSNDGLPFIGQIGDELYLSTAYNGWGMTNGTLAGKVIADLIIKKSSDYKELFNPSRSNFSLFFSSFTGSFYYAKAYIQSLWKKNIPNYIKINGIMYGVYIDEENVRHIVKLICPHMKCSLVFNDKEKTWDCPCHGSRFDLDGNIIEGPAVKNIKK